PGERRCQYCGRLQPLSRLRPSEDAMDDEWEQPDPRRVRSGEPHRQERWKRGEALEQPPAYRSRPSSQQRVAARPPRLQRNLVLKIVLALLAVAALGLGGAIAVVLAQSSRSPAGQTTTSAPNVGHCTAHGGPALTFQDAPEVDYVYDALLPNEL